MGFNAVCLTQEWLTATGSLCSELLASVDAAQEQVSLDCTDSYQAVNYSSHLPGPPLSTLVLWDSRALIQGP